MAMDTLTQLLATLTSQMPTTSKAEEETLERLQASIAGALVDQDLSTVHSQQLIFEKSDLFQAQHLPAGRLEKIDTIVKRVREAGSAASTRVLIRNTPVRSTQLPGSNTHAFGGTRVVTHGPIIGPVGPIFIDFVNVKKLITLYVAGQAQPAILFDASFSVKKLNPNPQPELTKNYKIVPETVWISAKLLVPTAAADKYCPLRVTGGTIALDTLPQIIGGKLTITAATTATCAFQLEQAVAPAGDAASPYGVDARNATFTLPAELKFTFKGAAKTIQAISPSSWKVYGQAASFTYAGAQNCSINTQLNRLCIPVNSSIPAFEPVSQSPFFKLTGKAKINHAWWGLPMATLDIAHPLEADGNGAIIIECDRGLHATWTGMERHRIGLPNPYLIGEPGRIGLSEVKSNGLGTTQRFDLWKDEQAPFGTSMEWNMTKEGLLLYNTITLGYEVLAGITDCIINADRPVKVNGEAIPIRSKKSLYVLALNNTKQYLVVVDPDMLQDGMAAGDKIPKVRPFGLAMHNALFTVTPPNTLLLYGDCAPDLKSLKTGKLYLAYGLFSYLPTLPDPYAANLGILSAQFNDDRVESRRSVVRMWLISYVQWEPKTATEDKVGVSFHFAPLQEPFLVQKDNGKPKKETLVTINEGVIEAHPDNRNNIMIAGSKERMAHLFAGAQPAKMQASEEDKGEQQTLFFQKKDAPPMQHSVETKRLDPFATSLQWQDFRLLDVSSKANQMGVAYTGTRKILQLGIIRQYDVQAQDEANAAAFPILVNGLDVVAEGRNAQAFTVPQIAWEPVFNLTPPEQPPVPGDPPLGFNYYPNDGAATRVGNLSKQWVPLSPIPMAKYLVETYRNKEDSRTYALFNLPFGMVAVTVLNNNSAQETKPGIENIRPAFDNYINGGIQLELTAGTSLTGGHESNLFEGFTAQLLNVNNADGSPAHASTLAGTPTEIFNNEFLSNTSNLTGRPAVPLERIGLSGYGASTFSNWTNKDAVFAQTSQAVFNVTTGRTSHEVVQVKSMIYPWGIRVVRTITIFRLANGYVMRIDSGWQAESDGKFDFTYNTSAGGVITAHDQPYNIHPGTIHGLFGVRNIHEAPKTFSNGAAKLQALTFDADVQLEHVVEGGKDDRVPSKGIVGYVQISPAGEPISEEDFAALLAYEKNTIGGPVNCLIKVADTEQRMKLDRFDVNNSIGSLGGPAFVGAVRGSVVLPKDGSWSLVQHTRGTGEVTPLPEQLSVPLIRFGKWIKGQVVNAADAAGQLVRIAYPGDLLKVPDGDTINFGFLQNMGTQKVLFLTPAFKNGLQKMMSKTPPLLADAYRLMNSKGIFPNVGDAENDFGTVIQLIKGIDGAGNPMDILKKADASITDLGKEVWDVMEISAKKEGGKLIDQGFKLLKGGINDVANKALKFDLPEFAYPLVDITGLKIYVEYKAASKSGGGAKNYVGKFDFDVDSFAADLADTWKGRMNNLAMIVDLGPMKRLMTIKGNFNSQKGQETDLGSSNGSDNSGLTLPRPEIEFSDDVKPVIQILEILAALSTGEYGEALKKGLKVAMGNSANIWEYKFEATKDIPIVRFPPLKEAYDSPQTPLKLEASLAIGVFFNAALKVTTDPKQLLPTAGAFFKFHGGLQVMCFSVGAGSIFAIGEVDLKLAADTSPLISLQMKFGFGVQLAVGLPVIGNVSVTFMVGIEIYVDSSQVLIVTAIMMFRGHAEILGGLVGITITIEARGSIEKTGPGQPTNCKAQVTFALDISICFVIDLDFSESWEETRQIA